MSKFARVILLGLFALLPAIQAQALDPDRLLPASRIKPTGDIMLDSRLRIGRDQGGKFIGTMDGLEISGKIKGSIPSLVTTQTTPSGSVGEGSAFREITRIGGFGQYGDDLLAYNITAPTPAGQFDVGRTTWVTHRNLTGGQVFAGWDGANSPSSSKDYSGNPLTQTWTGGGVIGREINAGNRWGEFGLQLTPGARFVTGLNIVPDPIPASDGPGHGAGVPVYHGSYGIAFGPSIHGHKWWVARYVAHNTTPAGGYPDLVSGGSTAENAPGAFARYQGFTNRGFDFRGVTFAGPQIDAPGWSVSAGGKPVVRGSNAAPSVGDTSSALAEWYGNGSNGLVLGAQASGTYPVWLQTKQDGGGGGYFSLWLNPVAGDVGIANGHWQYGHMLMGGYHFWIDSAGRLRQKGGVPTSDVDGSPLGGVDPSYSFANLPSGSPGTRAYCTNCREPGQAAGAGTGMTVFLNASGWRSTAGGAAAN